MKGEKKEDVLHHTQEPWVVDPHDGSVVRGGPLKYYANWRDRPQVALATGHQDMKPGEREANAILIAGAPGMYGALRHILVSAGEMECQGCDPKYVTCNPCEIKQVAERALAKMKPPKVRRK